MEIITDINDYLATGELDPAYMVELLKIATAELEQYRWVPITERLPDPHVYVWVANGIEIMPSAHQLLEGRWFKWVGSSWAVVPSHDVANIVEWQIPAYTPSMELK